MDIPYGSGGPENNRVLTLWMFRYHTGSSPEITYDTPMFFEFVYAEDRETARRRIDELKPEIRAHLIVGGWTGEIWEELLEPAKGGFNTGKTYLEGKITLDENGKLIPKPEQTRYR